MSFMTKMGALAVVCCAAAAVALGAEAAPGDDEILLDRVAAVVNGRVITLSTVQQAAAPRINRIPPDVDTEAAKLEAMNEALQELIDEELLADAIQERRIEVTEQEVDRAITEVRRQHGMTESEFRQALMGEGLTWESYRREIAVQLERYKLLGAEVQARVDVTDEEVRGYLSRHGEERIVEEARVSHILIRLPDQASETEVDDARRRANEAVQRITSGEDFAAVAREVSDDPSSERGGELGWLRRGRMVRELDEAVFETDEGEVVGPVRSPSGWHVIEIAEKRSQRMDHDSISEERAHQVLMEEALEEETRRFLDGLRRRAVIEIKIPEMKE